LDVISGSLLDVIINLGKAEAEIDMEMFLGNEMQGGLGSDNLSKSRLA
jgi:hypothetical protein